jgi:hypothetical protein
MLGESLTEKLKSDGARFEFIGLGKNEQDNDCLFVYVRPRDTKNLRQAPQEWQGISVKYIRLGNAIKPM